MTARITAGLLCDAVRQEHNGKLLAIGVYPSAVLFETYPSVVAFTLLARFEYDTPGHHELHLRVKKGDEVILQIDGHVDASVQGEGWTPLQIQPIEVTEPTSLSVEQQVGDEDWATVFQIPLGQPT